MNRALCNAIIRDGRIEGKWGSSGPSGRYPLDNLKGNELILCQGYEGSKSLTIWTKLDESNRALGTTFYPRRMDDFLRDLQKETEMLLTSILEVNDVIIYRLHKPGEKINNPFAA